MEWNGIERNGMEWSKKEKDVHACIPLYLLSHLIYLLLMFSYFHVSLNYTGVLIV